MVSLKDIRAFLYHICVHEKAFQEIIALCRIVYYQKSITSREQVVTSIIEDWSSMN